MSIIANKYAKKVYLTDDNPRNENANSIRKTLKKYCHKANDISRFRSNKTLKKLIQQQKHFKHSESLSMMN